MQGPGVFFAHLVYGKALERRGSELGEGHALVFVVHACDGESDADGLAAPGDSEVVQYGRHLGGSGGGGGALICGKHEGVGAREDE